MNNTLKTIIGIALAAGLFGTACSDQSNESRAATDDDAAEVQTAAAETTTESEAPSASAEAYEAVLLKVRALEQTASSATTREAATGAIGKMEALLSGFIGEHPGSAEANDARFQLGTLYYALQQLDKSIAYMTEFVDNSGGQKSDKLGYAHYYLGEAYKSADRFEKAKKHYSLYVEEYGHLNRQLLANVTASLEDLDTLKKLAIGGDPIPFDVKGIDGKELSLEKYRGKVVLIDFWATWCGPCRVEMPNVVNLHKKYREKGFEIIGVSLDRDRSVFDSYIKSNDMVWPQYFDGAGWNNRVAAKYKVRSIPATYLIDRRGKIRYRSLRGKELEEAVAELVKERA
ncbi:MAG: redoxin domain-containing protein [Candidatus Krumholzibacteriia bacterium]